MRLKNIITLVLAICLAGGVFAGCGGNQEAEAQDQQAQENAAGKKAILVVSFGTSYNDAREASIESVENKIKDNFKDYEVRRAFTSQMIIKKLKERDNLAIDNPDQALQKLKDEGFTRVVVQPLHIIPGEEYDEMRAVVAQYEDKFDELAMGRPVLYSKGGEDIPDDYTIAVEALQEQLLKLGPDTAAVVMGHGTHHPANASYVCLQSVLGDMWLNVYVGTVEGYPSLDNVMKKLEANQIKNVILMPYMLVAGDHAQNDMAGDEEDSWKTQLKKEGYAVDVYLHGLGENPAYQDIYVQHVKDAMASLN